MPDSFGNLLDEDLLNTGDISEALLKESEAQRNRRIGDPGGNIILNALLRKRQERNKITQGIDDVRQFSSSFLDIMMGNDIDGARNLVDFISQKNPARGAALAELLAEKYIKSTEAAAKLEGINKALAPEEQDLAQTQPGSGIDQVRREISEFPDDPSSPGGRGKLVPRSKTITLEGEPARRGGLRFSSVNELDGYFEGQKLKTDMAMSKLIAEQGKLNKIQRENAATATGAILIQLMNADAKNYNTIKDEIIANLNSSSPNNVFNDLPDFYRQLVSNTVSNTSAVNPITEKQFAFIMSTFENTAFLKRITQIETAKMKAEAQGSGGSMDRFLKDNLPGGVPDNPTEAKELQELVDALKASGIDLGSTGKLPQLSDDTTIIPTILNE